MKARKEFLGRGWAFPFRFDPSTGGVALSEYEDNIRENITVILSTRPGERQMLPDFGCRVHEALFTPATRASVGLVAQEVESALRRWEPRIEVEGVRARLGADGVHVEVDYRIRATGQPQSLQYRFSTGPASNGKP